MTEGPPYASDNWDIQGYASPAEEIDDMANVGRSLMDHIAAVVSSEGPFKGWSPADDPAEIVSDMANWIAELTAEVERLQRLLRQRDRMAKNSTAFWVRAAKEALAGKPLALRNRVDMAEAPPADVVQS